MPDFEHESVLVGEVLQYLSPRDNEVYVDCTVGGGGHQAVEGAQLEVAEAAPADAVYMLDRMLIEVRNRGTGRPARSALPAGLVVAGKTGTSNDYRDSWFSGFSGSHLVVVWMGHDDNSQTGLTGTTGALAAWSKLMSSITTSSFEPLMPESLENRWIDYYSGRETSPACDGSAVSMPFRYGTSLTPDDYCPPGGTEPASFETGDIPLEPTTP